MFGKYSLASSMLKKHWRAAALAAGAIPLLAAGSSPGFTQTATAPQPDHAVQLMFTVPVTKAKTNKTNGMYSFDISFVDPKTNLYVLGDRSNAAVDEVDAATGLFKGQLTANFAGVATSCATGNNNDCSGPNGVAIGGGCIFAGDGPSRVVSFNQATGHKIGDIKTGGKFRADEMAFDPADRILFVINNADNPPFGTFIHVSPSCGLTRGNRLTFITANGVDAQNGAEQPAWDPITKRFYNSIPQVGMSPQIGGVVRIKPNATTVEATVLTPFCNPAGLSIGKNDIALAGCNVTFDTAGNKWDPTKNVTATPYQFLVDLRNLVITGIVPGAGSSDEVWYNSADDHFYTGSSSSPYAPSVVVSGGTAVSQGAAVLGVIDGTSQSLDQLVPTFNVPAVKGVHPSGTSHSVAANSANGWVFVPLPANNAVQGCLTGCIGVYGRPDDDND